VPLSDLYPDGGAGSPRVVTLGGRECPARPLRVDDLPAFERWAAATLGDPCEGLDESDPGYADRLRAAYDPARAWPPEFGDEAVWDLIHTPEGLALTVAVCLGLSRAESLAIVDDEAATPAEWAAFHAFAWSLTPSPYEEVVRRIDRLIGCPEFSRGPVAPGEPISWTRAVAEQADGDPGRLAAIGRLTLGQWRALRTGGDDRQSEPLPGDSATRQAVMDLRGEFWAEERRRKREARRPKGSAPLHPVPEAPGSPGQHAHDQDDQGQVGQPPG